MNLQEEAREYVYRKRVNGSVTTYEIGEIDIPISDYRKQYPDSWCDRRMCEGFWGDEEKARMVVDLLNLKQMESKVDDNGEIMEKPKAYSNFLSYNKEVLKENHPEVYTQCEKYQNAPTISEALKERKELKEKIEFLQEFKDGVDKEGRIKWEEIHMDNCKQCGFPQSNKEYKKLEEELNQYKEVVENFDLSQIDSPIFTHSKQFMEHFRYIKKCLLTQLKTK